MPRKGRRGKSLDVSHRKRSSMKEKISTAKNKELEELKKDDVRMEKLSIKSLPAKRARKNLNDSIVDSEPEVDLLKK
jgi:hypothetical protein